MLNMYCIKIEFVYIHILFIYIYVYIYIYIYIIFIRERERDLYIYLYTYMHKYLHLFIHLYVFILYTAAALTEVSRPFSMWIFLRGHTIPYLTFKAHTSLGLDNSFEPLGAVLHGPLYGTSARMLKTSAWP